ncbi:MAG: hypothetical protein AAF198_05195 [Pseudomonadota bacterium]
MKRLKHFEPLTEAETALLKGQVTGNRIGLGDGGLPDIGSDSTEIRSEFLRILLLDLDSDVQLHPSGLKIRGAVISGQLDLRGCAISADISFMNCLFEKPINLINTRLRGLHLNGCMMPGFQADQAVFDGPLYIRAGCHFSGELSLPSVVINGDFQLCSVEIEPDTGAAVFANGLTVRGSVFLGNYPYSTTETDLIAHAPIYMASIYVDRDFYLDRAALTGVKNVVSAPKIDAIETGSVAAFSLTRSRIGGLFFAKSLQVSGGIVNLSGVTVKRLNDEPALEDSIYRLRLDGFQYEAFAQHTDISVGARLHWLGRRPEDIGFSAQPYEHLARVYEQLGHRDDSDRVRMAKEELQRRDDIAIRLQQGARIRAGMLWIARILLKFFVGYGYRPVYALAWAMALILVIGFFFQKTWQAGDMTPNSAPILISKDWISATKFAAENPGAYWSSRGQAGQDYETFNAFAYAADLMIPIVNLGQEDAWAPSTTRSWWGRQGWWIRWVAKVLGWVFTALGAAAVTGMIRRS